MSVDFEIKERHVGEVVVLDISGNIDVKTAPSLKIKLESLIRFGHQKIVVNLSNVDFIDSSGVGSLMYGLKMVNPINGGIKIIGMSPQNFNVFSVLELDSVFAILSSEEQAIGSFHSNGSTMH